MPHPLDYYTSERFIHDDLIREARHGLQSIYTSWAGSEHIDCFVLSWPSHDVEFHGHKTASVLPFDLPKDRTPWPTMLQQIAKATMAYALLLVEQREKAIVVIFESQHGTKSWHIPIQNHGNVRVLGDPIEKTNHDSIGLLWSPRKYT